MRQGMSAVQKPTVKKHAGLVGKEKKLSRLLRISDSGLDCVGNYPDRDYRRQNVSHRLRGHQLLFPCFPGQEGDRSVKHGYAYSVLRDLCRAKERQGTLRKDLLRNRERALQETNFWFPISS